ncbi:MAG: hypothetical protein M1830_001103 [Pleopsidium flavum]|nr:MAG: hypothetical protein M1830_001103 [Pleopsidium flavum]
MVCRATEKADKLQPPQPTSPNPSSSPSDVPDPSPIAPSSNGTEGTDIDDSVMENEDQTQIINSSSTRPLPRNSVLMQPELTIKTSNPTVTTLKQRSDEDEQPQSVIHAPPGFGDFTVRGSALSLRRSTPSPSQRSDITIKSPAALEVKVPEKKPASSPVSPPPITTSITPVKDWSERATPRAQTRQEFDAFDQEKFKRQRSSSLEDIPEGQDVDHFPEEEMPEDDDDAVDKTIGHFQDTEDEINALRTALSECWTLCNTLAGLSYIHRERIFSFAGKDDAQEQAWKSCWKLCQKLYDSRDEDYASQVRPTLDLCRDFCQSLFEVRQRDNDVGDSVLRVSFELNNHLYNTHDRTLPEAFRERTLDFYITLCHRLMKQRTRLAEETDSLLRACWSLAEMLFSLRQNQREGKQADEELLGSAVQACWELCDIFREGWTQVRPDRGTPRPSQTTFTQAFQQAKQSELAMVEEANSRQNPETPTTVFEDTQTLSPDDAPVPNILVLGPDQHARSHPKWSSTSSTLSGYSQSSEKTTSSTNTVTTPSEDPNLTCLKILIIKAAMNSGYQRGGPYSLAVFVKSLSSNAFGNLPWHGNLLDAYKKLVSSDPGFRVVGPPRRASAADVERAVQWMVKSGQYVWLRDLFRLVFGFHTEEAELRQNVTIQT